MIMVMTNDGQIRDLDQTMLALVDRVKQNLDVIVNLMSEGPCCEHVGLYSILDKICTQFNFPKKRITISTANLIEEHCEYVIRKDFNFWELEKAIENSKKFEYTDKIFGTEFRHFGNFIGHSNKYRLYIASQLHAHYKEETLQSYHCQVTDPYHRNYIGIEDLMFAGHSKAILDQAYDLISSAPIKIDNIKTFPILQPANIELLKYYPKFFVEIVNLSFFSGRTFYVDEKIWRPMLALTPFMVQGPRNFIVNLRKLGFKTFHQWWDEGYSEDPDDCQVGPILHNVQQLAKLSRSELQNMYDDMKPVLEHNRNLLLSLTKESIENIFN